MKAISYWALLNPKSTWLVLTILHIVLGVLTIYMGIILLLKGIALPDFLFITGVVVFVSAWVLYPVRRSKYKIWKWSYARQKVLDFGLVMGGLMMLITVANHEAGISIAKVDHSNGIAFQVGLKENLPAPGETSIWERIKISNLKKKLQEKYTTLVQHIQKEETEKSSSGLARVGIVLLMLVLIVGAIALGCSIDCNGGNGIGLLLALIFTVFVVMLGVRWIKWIKASKGD